MFPQPEMETYVLIIPFIFSCFGRLLSNYIWGFGCQTYVGISFLHEGGISLNSMSFPSTIKKEMVLWQRTITMY